MTRLVQEKTGTVLGAFLSNAVYRSMTKSSVVHSGHLCAMLEDLEGWASRLPDLNSKWSNVRIHASICPRHGRSRLGNRFLIADNIPIKVDTET